MSKVCEKLILKQYRDPLERAYDKFQFPYRSVSSSVCSLISLHEKALELLDDVDPGMPIDANLQPYGNHDF